MISIRRVLLAKDLTAASEPALNEFGEAVRRESARRALDESVYSLDAAVRLEPRILEGRAHEQVVAFGKREQADVIIVGARRSHATDRRLFGSIADRVVRGSPCAVWVHRPKEAAPLKKFVQYSAETES